MRIACTSANSYHLKLHTMASKRHFKKQLNHEIFDAVEACFEAQIRDASKTEASNQLVEEIVEFRNGMRERVHTARTAADFRSIRDDARKGVADFSGRAEAL